MRPLASITIYSYRFAIVRKERRILNYYPQHQIKKVNSHNIINKVVLLFVQIMRYILLLLNKGNQKQRKRLHKLLESEEKNKIMREYSHARWFGNHAALIFMQDVIFFFCFIGSLASPSKMSVERAAFSWEASFIFFWFFFPLFSFSFPFFFPLSFSFVFPTPCFPTWTVKQLVLVLLERGRERTLITKKKNKRRQSTYCVGVLWSLSPLSL